MKLTEKKLTQFVVIRRSEGLHSRIDVLKGRSLLHANHDDSEAADGSVSLGQTRSLELEDLAAVATTVGPLEAAHLVTAGGRRCHLTRHRGHL